MQITAFMMMLQAASNPVASFLPLIAIVAIFYFLVFMPMQKQKKAQAQMLAELQAGAEILTTGGNHGHHRQHCRRYADPPGEA